MMSIGGREREEMKGTPLWSRQTDVEVKFGNTNELSGLGWLNK